MRPIRGIVTSVLDGLHIRTEGGSSIHWPHKTGLKLGSKALIFYDFTRQKIRKIVAAKKYPITNELEEDSTEDKNENIDHNQLFETDTERQLDNT